MTEPKISDRNTSVIEKQIPIATQSKLQEKHRKKKEKCAPSMALFSPISFSDSCSITISSTGVSNSLCRTRGRLEVTLPNAWDGVVTIELNTERTRFLGSVWPSRMDTIRGR
jgi:hypothetical protein